MLNTSKLLRLYHRLFEAYGPQYWWPAESPLEVVVGAVLTQNTILVQCRASNSQSKSSKTNTPAGHA